MISSGGSGKWVLAIFGAILLVVTLCYPDQVVFILKFIWDLIVQNLKPLFEGLFKH